MLTLMYFILIIASIYFILISHPLLMGLLIMLSTLAITVYSGLFLSSFWLSYLIFIIYLGAMLILFAYISSMAPNEMVTPRAHYLPLLSSLTLLTLMKLPLSPLFSLKLNISLTKMFSNNLFPLLTLLVVYLLLAMISIIFTVKFYSGPLRMKT